MFNKIFNNTSGENYHKLTPSPSVRNTNEASSSNASTEKSRLAEIYGLDMPRGNFVDALNRFNTFKNFSKTELNNIKKNPFLKDDLNKYAKAKNIVESQSKIILNNYSDPTIKFTGSNISASQLVSRMNDLISQAESLKASSDPSRYRR